MLGFDASELQLRLLDLQAERDQAIKQIEKLDADQDQKLADLELRLAEAKAARRRAELKVDVPEDLSSAIELQQARYDVEIGELEVASLEGQLEALRRAGEAQRAVLEGQRDRAERQVQQNESAIERMTVVAPRGGTIIYVSNRSGDKKKVGDSVWRFESVIELPDLAAMMAVGEVDEADSGRIAEGQTFRINLDAHPDVDYRGTVESIWQSVQRKSGSRHPLKVVRLDMALAETDTRRMRPGMRFRGTVETDRLDDVLVVPVHAVFRTDEGPVVYRRTAWGYERRVVELGLRNSTSVQVVSGLQAGDLIAETQLDGL